MKKHIKFETDQSLSRPPRGGSRIERFLLSHNIVKNGTQAHLLLLCVALTFLLVSLGIFLSAQAEPDAAVEPDPDTLIE